VSKKTVISDTYDNKNNNLKAIAWDIRVNLQGNITQRLTARSGSKERFQRADGDSDIGLNRPMIGRKCDRRAEMRDGR
jgi:Tfp pilus assembly ATPase PilU